MVLRRDTGVPQCNQVTKMPLATIALLFKQTIDNFHTSPAPWRHLSGNHVLFVPHQTNSISLPNLRNLPKYQGKLLIVHCNLDEIRLIVSCHLDVKISIVYCSLLIGSNQTDTLLIGTLM